MEPNKEKSSMEQSIFRLIMILNLFCGIMIGSAHEKPASVGFRIADQQLDRPNARYQWFLSAGPIFSKYLGEEGNWGTGFRAGLTLKINVTEKAHVSLPFTYATINASPMGVESEVFANDGFIYRAYVNKDISIGLFELPLLLSYTFLPRRDYGLSYLAGVGLVIAHRDFSKPVQPDDVRRTSEVIGTHEFPPDPVETRFTIPNSGLNIHTGVRLHANRFYCDMIYVLYPYEIKEINKLNGFSLILAIGL